MSVTPATWPVWCPFMEGEIEWIMFSRSASLTLEVPDLLRIILHYMKTDEIVHSYISLETDYHSMC